MTVRKSFFNVRIRDKLKLEHVTWFGDRDVHLLRRWKGMNLKMSPAPIILIAHEKSHNQKRDNVNRSYYFTPGKIVMGLLSILYESGHLKINGHKSGWSKQLESRRNCWIWTVISTKSNLFCLLPLKWPFSLDLDRPLFEFIALTNK